VSSAITTVDVVGPHDGPGELLGKEIQLVRGFRTTEHAEALKSVRLRYTPQAVCGAVKSFTPTDGTKLSIFPDHGIYEPIFRRVFHVLLHAH